MAGCLSKEGRGPLGEPSKCDEPLPESLFGLQQEEGDEGTLVPKAFLILLVSPLPQEGQNTTLTSPAFLTNPLEQETHVDNILLWHIKRNWIAGLTLSLAGFLCSDGLLPVPTTVPPPSREGRGGSLLPPSSISLPS